MLWVALFEPISATFPFFENPMYQLPCKYPTFYCTEAIESQGGCSDVYVVFFNNLIKLYPKKQHNTVSEFSLTALDIFCLKHRSCYPRKCSLAKWVYRDKDNKFEKIKKSQSLHLKCQRNSSGIGLRRIFLRIGFRSGFFDNNCNICGSHIIIRPDSSSADEKGNQESYINPINVYTISA